VIALDTNVLVRLAVADHEAQTAKAAGLLARAAADEEPLYVADIVLCELAWVLTRSFGFSRTAVAETIQGFLESPELTFRDATAITQALAAHERSEGDFADHLIAATARAAGCDAVVTFDKALQGLPGFRAV
jgi:predicted nucleic-acid-binding protein